MRSLRTPPPTPLMTISEHLLRPGGYEQRSTCELASGQVDCGELGAFLTTQWGWSLIASIETQPQSRGNLPEQLCMLAEGMQSVRKGDPPCLQTSKRLRHGHACRTGELVPAQHAGRHVWHRLPAGQHCACMQPSPWSQSDTATGPGACQQTCLTGMCRPRPYQTQSQPAA